MALTATTLSAACGPNDLTLYLTSTTNFAAGQAVKVDNEYMWCVLVPAAGGSIVVRSRGMEGTPAMAHDLLANVVTSPLVTDFPSVPLVNSALVPPSDPIKLTLGRTQTITLPLQNTIYFIDAPAAATITLPVPDKAHDGLQLFFTAQTAQLHVISGTGLIADGTATAPHNTATMAAAGKGATLSLLCDQGLYNILGNAGFTIA